MKIIEGLFDHMVLQRNSNNVSDVQFSGECKFSGIVKIKVTKGNNVMKKFNWIQVGKASSGYFHGCLKGLKVGGPYNITIRIDSNSKHGLEYLTVHDVMVGDVWILGGQSNMEGIGYLKYAEKPNQNVRAFYMDDKWGIARDPIHNLCDAVDQVHIDINGGTRVQRSKYVGVGPGVSFGLEMYHRTKIPQGLISCANGGTSMSQWSPDLKNLGSGSLYGAMLRRFKKNGSNIAGILWYQGESDTVPDSVSLYTSRMKNFVHSIRKDFGKSKLPFIIVQISRTCISEVCTIEGWNSIQEQQRRLPDIIEKLAVVPTVDLELDDCIHISGFSQCRLGRRLAQAMFALNNKVDKLPIVLKEISVVKSPESGTADVIVIFDNVIGKLKALGRPNGFEIVDKEPINCIYRIDLIKNQVILKTNFDVVNILNKSLYYGFGYTPYCNITDSDDRSLPAFGPIVIK